jgi:hypothetical protein
MGKVYESLRVVVQDTFQRGKADPAPLARVKSGGALTLNGEVEELEKIFGDKIARLKARVKENDEWVAGEAKHAEEIIEALTLDVATLETKLRETEDTSHKRDVDRQKTEEALNAKILTLENDARIRREMLESRANEINDLKSKTDSQLKQIGDLQAALQKGAAEAASQAQRAEDLTKNLKDKIAGLESQLRDRDDILERKESAIKRLEQNLNAKIGDLESRIAGKDKLLAGRDAEINALKSQLKVLTKGIGQMASLFRNAEALATDGPAVSQANLNEPSRAGQNNPAAMPSNGTATTTVAPDVAADIVSDYAFGDIIRELAELTNVIGLVASVVVRDHVAALGESMERFPQARLPELVESLSQEILDQNRKTIFRDRVGKLLSPEKQAAV